MANVSTASMDYARAMTNASTAPKEIGYLQRVEGANTGLSEVLSRLESLESRILNHPPSAATPAPMPPQGLPGHLSEIEGRIREALMVIGRLESSF